MYFAKFVNAFVKPRNLNYIYLESPDHVLQNDHIILPKMVHIFPIFLMIRTSEKIIGGGATPHRRILLFGSYSEIGGGGHPAPPHPFILQICAIEVIVKMQYYCVSVVYVCFSDAKYGVFIFCLQSSF